MSITYPLTLPSGNRMSVSWKPQAAVAVSMSPYTFQQQAQAHQGQLWRATVSLVPMPRDEAAAWVATLLALNGRYGTFHLGDPLCTAPRGALGGVPVVDGAAQTGQTLATKGWTASKDGVLLKGDYIQLGTGSTRRLYMVLTDVDADASGEATLDIWPRLRESPGDGAALVTTSPEGTFRMASNEMAWEIDNVALFGVEFEAVEAI